MSSEESNKAVDKLCGLCNENTSKYCCPRCEVLYCSLDCYKSENHLECSESFYRECVNRELASHQVDESSKNRMIEILKRMQEEDDPEDNLETIDNLEEVDSDDASEEDLHARLQDLNLDDADAIWNALTEDEKNEFEAMLSKGDVGSIIPQWEPWWMFRKEKKLVQEVKDANLEEEALKLCPEIKTVPEFSTLTSVKPSPAIRFNMANVIASYAFIMRYFNGEIQPVEAATYVLNICMNLSSNTNFEDPELSVESVAQKCLQSEILETDNVSLEVMKKDTLLILQGPSDENKLHYSKSALSHLIQIFSQAKSAAKTAKPNIKNYEQKGTFSRKFPTHTNDHLPDLDLSKTKKVIKKLEYYLSFLGTCDNE